MDRINVQWGGYSQIKCELKLLKSAIEHNYDYYHLISGVYLPLKTQDYIHNFMIKIMVKNLFILIVKNVI